MLARTVLAASVLLVASAPAHAVSASLGIDWDALKIELIDLDPSDGIAPLHDTTLRVQEVLDSGPGASGSAAFERLEPFGGRYFTAGGAPGSFGVTVMLDEYETTLSAQTAIVFSAPSFASVSFAPGETADVSGLIRARLGSGDFVSDGLGASSGGGPPSVSRMLSIRLDNLTAETVGLSYGLITDVYVESPGVTPIPEPQTWALIALGLPLVAAAARRRQPRR